MKVNSSLLIPEQAKINHHVVFKKNNFTTRQGDKYLEDSDQRCMSQSDVLLSKTLKIYKRFSIVNKEQKASL